MSRYKWSRLNHLQVGRYAEYFVKMELTLFGYQVYTSEVDDRGIDFVICSEFGRFFEIQVKSIRGLNYIFFPKHKFVLRPSLLAAVVLLIEDRPPAMFLIPSLTWEQPNSLMVSHDYEGKRSKPEWGLNLSNRNLGLLEPFAFEKISAQILGETSRLMDVMSE